MNVVFIYFVNVIIDWYILKPDLRSQSVKSVLVCAFVCHQQKCTTFNVLLDDNHIICQMSKRKGTCMEKTDASPYPGFRMFQVKETSRIKLNHEMKFAAIPPIKMTRRLHLFFHPHRLLVLAAYKEEPMFYTRLLAYVIDYTHHTFKLLYNSSIIYMPSFYTIYKLASNYYTIYRRIKVGAKKISIGNIAKLYDISKGSFVGQLVIPPEEKCLHSGGWRNHYYSPVHTVDLRVYVLACSLPKEGVHSVTTYYSFAKYEETELIVTLFPNKTVTLAHGKRAGFIFSFLFRNDACLYFITESTAFIFFRNIRLGLTNQQKFTLPIRQIRFLAVNYITGIFLEQNVSPLTDLFGVAISCSPADGLGPDTENRVTRTYIETRGVRRLFVPKKAMVLGRYMKLLRIYAAKDKQGYSKFDGVHVFNR
ncbi:uncharacterized protein LOC135493670 [Lineus longissimus]|uniref:uncharacterized protein LOC135493670 n=1 Tax=Lineus longissimus TaxID=88925 RepID=UPI00315D1E14